MSSTDATFRARFALVTGGNRGLGLAACKEFVRAGASVLLACRNLKDGEAAVKALEAEFEDAAGRITAVELDVSQEASVKQLVALVQERYAGKIDALVNNAAVCIPGWEKEGFDKIMAVNVWGVVNLTEALIPLLAPGAHIANVSSGLGSINLLKGEYATAVPAAADKAALRKAAEFNADSEQGKIPPIPGQPATIAMYNLTKAVLNRYTQLLSVDEGVTSRGIIINAVCPGWCSTDMGGANAPRAPEVGGKSIYQAATVQETGKFWRDGEEVAW